MLFSSIPFLYYFLPLTLLCYFLAPRRAKNAVLLFFSLIFYAWGEPKYVLFMVASILQGYLFGRLVEKSPAVKAFFDRLGLVQPFAAGLL